MSKLLVEVDYIGLTQQILFAKFSLKNGRDEDVSHALDKIKEILDKGVSEDVRKQFVD